MAFRHKRICHGCRARSGPKGFWRKQLQSMADRSGRANSVRSRMCGQDGVAGNAIITSRRRCSISRRSQQSQETCLLARRARVERKSEKFEVWKPRIKSVEHELMLWERRKEHKKGQVSSVRKKETRKKCGETLWKSRMTPSVAENWMNRGKMQRELREVERLSFASKEVQENLVESLQHQLQEVEKKRNDLMTEHHRVQEAWRQETKCGTSEEKLSGWKSASHCCRTKSTKTKRQVRKWKHCKLEKKEGAAMLRRQEIAAWRPHGSKLLPCVLQWVQTRSMPWPMLSTKGSRKVEQFRSRCQEEMKEEVKAEPVSKLRCPCQAGSIKLHQRAVWSLTFLVHGVYQVRAEVQEDHAKEVHPDRQDGFLGMRKGMNMWEDWCLRQKKNSQGKDPRTFEDNRQGRDPSTLERNSQGGPKNLRKKTVNMVPTK